MNAENLLSYQLKDTGSSIEVKPLKVTEASARNWLERRQSAYLSTGAVIHWLSSDRFIATWSDDTIADVSVEECR